MAAKQKVASLAELLTFLIQRGVVSGRKKIELVELCELAKEVSLVFDPDGLFEDREEVAEDATYVRNRTNIHWRSNAAGKRTVWLQDDLDFLYFAICSSQDMEVQVQSVTFSTDGWEKQVAVVTLSSMISAGHFFTSNNSDWGNNWNTFHTNYGPFPCVNWTTGGLVFGVQLKQSMDHDTYGVEIDQLSVRFSGNVTLEDLSCL